MASTVHVAPVVVTMVGPPLRDGAVAVEGDRVVAVGRREDVRAAVPAARVREHRGVLVPGLVDAHAVLEPGREREGVHALLRAGTAGVCLEGATAAGLRAAASAGLRAVTARDAAVPVLRGRGDAGALSGSSADGTPCALGTAGAGHDLLDLARDLLAVAARDGADAAGLAEVLVRAATTGGAAAVGLPGAGTLAVGGRADLAVLDVPTDGDPYAALVASGAGRCTATVLAGRLVHRR